MAYLSALVEKWAGAQGRAVAVGGFESAEAFFLARGRGESADLLLLDVRMGGESGMGMARRLRGEGYGGQIVFVTGYPDFAAEGYDVGALHYLAKPVGESKLFEVLGLAAARLREKPRAIVFPRPGGALRIAESAVAYAEVMSHTCTVHLAGGGSEEFRMRMSDMEGLLGEGFFKCHRSFVANMRHVRRVAKGALLLEDGRRLPLSRGLRDAACQAFIRWN